MPITAESLILLLTNTTQRLDQYFLIYMRLVNLTTNYYNASLEDRVLVSNYCLANVLKRQMKEELVGLQRINYCILCILQWYGSSRHSQNIFRSSIEWITLLEYIEHLFILGRSDEQQVIQLLDALYRKYVFNVEDKLFLIIRIRSYLNWTIQRLKNKFEANRFISRVLEWCKV